MTPSSIGMSHMDRLNRAVVISKITEVKGLWNLPSMSFLFPCTISFPATFTREKFNCFPIFTTWLQFSTFLNGIFIGGFDACFQLTDSGETLSRTSKRTHLQAKWIHLPSRFIWAWHYWGKTKTLPISDILENIINICSNSKTVNPQSEASLLTRSLCIICHHLSKGHLFGVNCQAIPAEKIICHQHKLKEPQS